MAKLGWPRREWRNSETSSYDEVGLILLDDLCEYRWTRHFWCYRIKISGTYTVCLDVQLLDYKWCWRCTLQQNVVVVNSPERAYSVSNPGPLVMSNLIVNNGEASSTHVVNENTNLLQLKAMFQTHKATVFQQVFVLSGLLINTILTAQ